MRTDFESLKDGDKVLLYPNDYNPLHKKPIVALYSDGYFYCDGTSPQEGPDYYLGDVSTYNDGFSDLEQC